MPGVQSSISESSLQFLAYLPCFLTGAMIAKVDLSRRIGIVLVIVGIAYFVFALHVPRANVHAAYALAYGGLVIVAMQPTGIIHRGLSRPLAVWLGERSYSLFLVHFSVLYLADYAASLLLNSRTIAYAVLSRGSGALLSLALAMGIFWLIERKFARNLVSGDEFWPWKLRPIREDHPASLREPLDAHSAIAR
jgi:peptidoglycan/LPS O-acetylase OafA/YrhL